MFSRENVHATCVITDGIFAMNPSIKETVTLFLLLFTLFIYETIKLVRNTYLIDMTSDNQGTDYVSLNNIIIGVMLLIIGIAKKIRE